MTSNAARVRDAMRRFIEKEIILVPMDTRETITAVGQWCQQNLTPFGAYVGMDLRSEGFPYARGDYVPVDKRYSAMLAHRRAMRAMGLANSTDSSPSGGWKEEFDAAHAYMKRSTPLRRG